MSVYIFLVYSIIYSIDKPFLEIMPHSRIRCVPLSCPINESLAYI